MEWMPILDLREGDVAAASTELGPLRSVWAEQRQHLKESGLLETFITRLVREWSVETGILERLYTIDHGVTQVLIEQGFDAALIPHGSTDRPATEVIEVLRDHQQSAELVFDVVRQERPLSVGLIKELHSLITRHQPHVEGQDQFGGKVLTQLIGGEFKKLPNNPSRPDGRVHYYCPPVQVDSEMDRLIEMHTKHLKDDIAVDVAAAWLHHRFTQIHPFADGNGRVARAITNIALIQADWFPLVIKNIDRGRYIAALECADDGDLAPLVALFGEIQRRAFVQVLSLSDAVRREDTSLDDLLDAIDDELAMSAAERETSYAEVLPLADCLLEIASDRLRTIHTRLEPQMQSQAGRGVSCTSRGRNDEGHDWNRFTLVRAARQLNYFANLDTVACWTRLRIWTDAGSWEIVVGLHGLGPTWRGVIAGSILICRLVKEEDQPVRTVDITPCVEEIFQLNYLDDRVEVSERFKKWLDRGLQTALQQWRVAMNAAQ